MSTRRSFAAGVSGAALVLSLFAIGGVQSIAPRLPEALPAAVPGAPAVHFTAAGDISASADAGRTLAGVRALAPDLHFALGDLSYGATGNEQAWCDFVTSAVGPGFPFEIIAGNHESNGINGNINDFTACLPNQVPGVVGTYGRQYYVDVPAQNPLVRYIMVSPGLIFPDGPWSYAAGSPRYQWTSAAIDGARAANIPWVVAGMHKPCISVGRYGCDSGSDIAALFVSKKVDLVLSGHEHIYARSKQIASGPGCTALVPGTYQPSCVADADDTLAKGAGTVFAIVGTGGTPLRDVVQEDPESGYFVATSGLNKQPSFGNLDVRLTGDSLAARFVPVGTGTFTDSFTIGPPDPTTNQPPVASFTSSCTALDCSFDAAGSRDPDGSITQYSWDFGDGSSASGATATRTYASAGSFSVRLTVTDNGGATGSTASTVSPAAAPPPPPPGTPPAHLSDRFDRTVASGWGTPDVGGAWTTEGAASSFSVSGGMGNVRMTRSGITATALSGSTPSTNTDLTVSFTADKAPTGSGIYYTIGGREVNATRYGAKVVLKPTGTATVALVRRGQSGDVDITTAATAPGVTFAPGDLLSVRHQVIGVNPTVLRVKLWKTGTPEPTAWIRSATDSTPELQVPGVVRVTMYLSGSATNAPVTARIDDIVARTP